MAQLGRFFDGIEYGSQDFSEFFSNFLQTGYFSGLQINANNNMESTVNIGSAFVEGYEYRNTEALRLTHDAADTTDNRIDRVVVRLDRSPQAEVPIRALIRKGNPSASPVPPVLVRDLYIYEISLAQVLIEAGKSFIEASQITDERDDIRYCGPAVSNGVLLEDNSRTPQSTIEEFPFGVSIMRVHEKGTWPTQYGILMTVRSTYNTAYQQYKNTGSPTSVMLIRHTSLGAFNDFEYILPDEGGNNNGRYRKGPGRTLECWHKVTATYQGQGSYLIAQWNFPLSFLDGEVVITTTRETGSNIAPSNTQIVDTVVASNGKDGATLYVYRLQGAPDFVTGNNVTLHLTAKGRY